MVLEDSSERAAHRMCDFLKSLSDAVIITPEQMSQVKTQPSYTIGGAYLLSAENSVVYHMKPQVRETITSFFSNIMWSK